MDVNLDGWVGISSIITVAVVFISYLTLVELHSPKKKSNFTIEASSPPLDPADVRSSSSSSLGFDCEVFLSFRGDTRTGFADYLYSDLIDAGIRAYRDKEELRVGDEIRPELLESIRSSSICIPIFSPNYASSKWCLLELSQMAGCMRNKKRQMILPIFYKVDPADVRNRSGCYEEAFREHEKRFDDRTVQQWSLALREVGALKGLESEKMDDGYFLVTPKVILSLFQNKENVSHK